MVVEIDISKLDGLRAGVERLLLEAQEMCGANAKKIARVPLSMTMVIVFCDKTLMVCYRCKKVEGSIEIARITSKDAEEGPLSKRAGMYTAKIAAFLEKRGLYQERGAITDKTPSLFAD